MNEHMQGDARLIQGVGVGLRSRHYQEILETRPDVPWFEVLADNYLGNGGSPLYYLEQIRRDYPVTFHCVGMSLGSTDPLEAEYLKRLKNLIERFDPAWVSDHLCWISVAGEYLHELIPLPYTDDAARHIAARILEVQDSIGRRILVENVSTYMGYRDSEMEEWEFVCRVVELADCELLLDVNNIYVSAFNDGFDPHVYLKHIPSDRVREIHLAGYEDRGRYLLDTHGATVHDPVWRLYEQALKHCGAVPTLIEWDTNIPEFDVLQAEASKARRCMQEICLDAA